MSPASPKAQRRGKEYRALAAAGTRALALRLALSWLVVALAFATVFAGRLASDPSASFGELAPLAIFSVAVLAAFALLAGKTLVCNARVLETATFLTGLGTVLQYRMGAFAGAAPLSGARLALPGGLLAMLLVFALFRSGRWRALEALAAPCYLAAIATMAALLAFGRHFRGGLYLPGNINPTDAAKPLLAVALAAFLARHGDGLRRAFLGLPVPKARPLLYLALLWLPVMALALAVRDFGLVMLLNVLLAAMLAAATRRPGWLLLFAVVGAAAGWLAWKAPGHIHARIAVWLDPFADPTGAGWQTLQGFSAMFAGGVWGAGLGAGLPVEVPIVATDFAYAAVAEELGMILCALILALYASLAARGFLSAGRPGAKFGEALAAGLTSVIAFQALLNLAGVVKALPLTGIVLPFLSQGGSGLVAMLATAGLLAAVEESE